ncbi:MAG: hypothetical protein GY821_00115 [Gammaproteobacteria bacterium]|nr:hypothetical protein [Gammaproteobacteria bacterium]
MSSNANNQQPNAGHQYKDVQGVWCEAHQVFVTERKYDLSTFKPLLMQHFQEGGWPSVPIMAGVCGVSDDMFRLWLDIGLWINNSYSINDVRRKKIEQFY